MRIWKGSYKVGDELTFGIPAGTVQCGESPTSPAIFSTMVLDGDWKGTFFGPYVLFLRQSQGNDTRLVQGLLPAAGDGLQGMFPIQIPVKSEADRECNGVLDGSVQWCDAYLETSQDPVAVPYALDPLAKKYNGVAISDFLRDVRSAASQQGLSERSSVR
jgi:hypothetical protein